MSGEVSEAPGPYLMMTEAAGSLKRNGVHSVHGLPPGRRYSPAKTVVTSSPGRDRERDGRQQLPPVLLVQAPPMRRRGGGHPRGKMERLPNVNNNNHEDGVEEDEQEADRLVVTVEVVRSA